MRQAMMFAALVVTAATGCKSQKAPNTAAPEDKVLFDFGNALITNDRATGLKLYDLDARQRTELWEKTIKKLAKPEDQNSALIAALPRLGDKAALVTVGNEAWSEAMNVIVPTTAEDLAAGKCVSGAPGRDDIGRFVIPKEKEGMPQELGLFVFQLRTALPWAPPLRVHCPTGEFWVQLAQRKKSGSDVNTDPPLLILRMEK